MSFGIRALAWVGVASVGLCHSAHAQPETYRFVPESSFVYVRLRPAPTLLSGLSHKHIVRASTFEGTVRYDPEDLARCAVRLSFPVASLVVDAPEDRKRIGLKDSLSPSDRADVRKNMLDEDQLHAEAHTSIRFVSTGCKKLADGRVQVSGGLTVRGKTAQISVPLLVAFADGLFHADGEVVLDHQAFGFKPYSAALGTLKNQAELRFGVEITGVRQ